jgi:hypothetical protein
VRAVDLGRFRASQEDACENWDRSAGRVHQFRSLEIRYSRIQYCAIVDGCAK